MTESTDTIANYRQSGCNNNDNPIDWFVVLNNHDEHADDKYGLFDNDDDDNLTLFDLKFIPKSEHDLSIFDELAHQCDAVLLATNLEQKLTTTTTTTTNNESHISNLLTTTVMNDYERRFQRSLQKLTIPSWYNDTSVSPKLATKPIVISISSHINQEYNRTPEIVHVNRPRSYRSCRSSLGTSPSPSIHSWHPNHVMDGMNFSSMLPSSSSTSRRNIKYEKGIERVTKSSRWYQPAKLITEKTIQDSIGTKQSQQEKSNCNHYDRPKFSYDEKTNSSDRIRQDFIPDDNIISRFSNQQQSKYLIDDINFNDLKNTRTKQKTRNNKSHSSIENDKHYSNYTQSNDFENMSSLTNDKNSFGCVELEEVTDDEDNDKQLSTNNIQKTSTKSMIDTNDHETNRLLQTIATNLVDSILNDALNFEKSNQNLIYNNDDEEEDINTGVRELSDDENALRELDENDMSGTDEFIVFATKPESSDNDMDDDFTAIISTTANNNNNNNNNSNSNQTVSSLNKGSLNRLYRFSRTSDEAGSHPTKQSSNQDSSTSELMIVDKDISRTNNLSNINSDQLFNTTINLDHNNSTNMSPTYRSHIQKRQINLGRYYDGMMRATNSHLPTYDIRSNVILNKPVSSEGVTEETVRQGRMLLDSIPNPIDIKNQTNEIISNGPTPTRKIVTTTITEEYLRIQRKKVVEEFDDEPSDEVCHSSDYSSHQEQCDTQQTLSHSVSINHQSPYESLANCYSGYSFIRSDFKTPVHTPLNVNVSSLQSTTDEAYESEPTTTSPRSPTISSSPITITTATTTTTTTTTEAAPHVHPNLIHEFEYPSPPPPVPDRRLKPPHLRPPPPVKPRSHQQRKDLNDYSTIDKTKPSPLTTIQHILASTSDDSTPLSTRLLSSRHYCGSLPVSNEPITSLTSQAPIIIKTNEIPKRMHRTLNDENREKPTLIKSNSSSLNRNRARKPSSAYFDEATNGLAIRLPAPSSKGQEITNKQNIHRVSRHSSTKQIDGVMRKRPISENLHMDRSSIYETSV